MKKRRGGFTLLEVIIATLIIVVLGSGIFAAISFAKRMSIRTQEKAIAISFIEKKLNELKNDPSSRPTTDGTYTESKIKANDGLTGTLKIVVDYQAEGDPNLWEIRVAFEWNDPFGAARTESAATVFYQ